MMEELVLRLLLSLAKGRGEDYLDDQIAQVWAALARGAWVDDDRTLDVGKVQFREFLGALGEAFREALEHGDKG